MRSKRAVERLNATYRTYLRITYLGFAVIILLYFLARLFSKL